MIAQVIAAAIQEKWPELKVSMRDYDLHWVEISVRQPLYRTKEKGLPTFGESIWVANIHVRGEDIKLSIIQDRYCYENVLSDPSSLDELYTILATYIMDVRDLIPSTWHSPAKLDEPTELEVMADKRRVAETLPSRLATKLQVVEWGN